MFNDLKQDDPNQDSTSTPQQPVNTTVPQSQTPSAPVHQSVSSNGINDMFSDVDPVAKHEDPLQKPSAIQSGKIKSISQTSVPSSPAPVIENVPNPVKPTLPPADVMSIKENSPIGKVIIIIAVLVLLALVAGAVYFFIIKPKINNSSINANVNTNVDKELSENPTNQNNNTINESEIKENPAVDQGRLDDDFDGLTNAEEEAYGTNPFEPDTDNDGLIDQDEVEVYNTNPLVADTDNDGLDDYKEVIVYLTDPNDADTDGDTYSDGVEVLNGYNPLGEGMLSDGPIDNLIIDSEQ